MNSKKRRTNSLAKLSPENLQWMLRQIAAHRTEKQIIAWAKGFLGTKISGNLISRYRNDPNTQDDIDRYRQEHDAAIGQEKYASKRIRLQEMSEAYNTIKENPKMSRESRAAYMDMITAMDRIDTLVAGKQKGDTSIQVNINKFSKISTKVLIAKAEELRKYITKEE